MKFTRTTEYALQVLVYLAANPGSRHSSDALHRALKIPKKYLQQLLTQLAKKELIAVTRGKYGGFVLSRPAARIAVADVVDAIEGYSTVYKCVFGLGVCSRSAPCPIHDPWIEAQEGIHKILTATKLADLLP